MLVKDILAHILSFIASAIFTIVNISLFLYVPQCELVCTIWLVSKAKKPRFESQVRVHGPAVGAVT